MGESTSSYLVFLPNVPVSFKVGLQGLKSQLADQEELLAVALTMKEVVLLWGRSWKPARALSA